MKTKEKVSDAAGTVKPYVDRAIHDEELRDNLRNAYAAAREVYDELIGRRDPVSVARRVATDKDIQDSLRRAVEELRGAADRVQGGRETHKGRNTMLLLSGIAIGILFNPVTGAGTRKWVKESLLGGGDDFGYDSSSTSNSTNNN
jgi:hypothetical protein